MSRFRVMVEGKNCLITMQSEKKGITRLFGRRAHPSAVGFFATRYVEAESRERAETDVLNAIRTELSAQKLLLNDPSDPPRISVAEAACIADSELALAGAGFTFYAEEKLH